MAHTLLFSGYGAPGCDDLAVCRLTADGTLEILSTLRHGRAPSFCCRGQNGWIYAASERADGADVTAYVLDGMTLREIARIEIPTGRGLCHLYACGDVIYGSCFENGLYFAVDSALTRILWQFQPAGANAHWVQSVGHALFLADLGNSRLYRLALENNLPIGSVKTLPQPTGSGPRQVLDAGDGMLDCVYELDGHMRVLNHDGCTVSTVQASTVPKPRSWPGGACATADGTLFVSNRGPQHHLGVAAQRPDPPFPLRMAHRRLAAGAVRGAGHPVSVGCLPTRGRGALLLLFTLAPPRPYRNRQPCAAWCFLRAGAGLIFVIVFSLFLIFYLFKLFFSAQ